MRVASSWSGGKDCALALHRGLEEGLEVTDLLTITAPDGNSRSHRIPADVFKMQAERLEMNWWGAPAEWDTYEEVFRTNLERLKRDGCEGMIFGDIELEEHREWCERICAEIGIEAIHPLWQGGQSSLVSEFLEVGFTAYIVGIKCEVLPADFTGRRLDGELIRELELKGLSPAGEHGEYHTLVVDGPPFSSPIRVDGDGFCLNEKESHAFWNFKVIR